MVRPVFVVAIVEVDFPKEAVHRAAVLDLDRPEVVSAEGIVVGGERVEGPHGVEDAPHGLSSEFTDAMGQDNPALDRRGDRPLLAY